MTQSPNLLTLGNVIISALILWPVSLSAQNCSVPPTCTELGFTKTAAQCAGIPMTRCPFDKNMVQCLSCEDLGYTETAADCGNLKSQEYIAAGPNLGDPWVYFRISPPILQCPYDKTKYLCKECPGIGKHDFCMFNNKLYGPQTIGCLPCEYKMTCGDELVFDESCKCCNYPK